MMIENQYLKSVSFAEEGHFPSLAEEISTVADALQGAPVHAKETVLKILERLTQRLDRAERDRDMAIGRYRELQARFEQLEEELSKKRGELRELLRQDSRAVYNSRRDQMPALSPLNGRYNCSTNTNGNGRAEDVPENLKKPTPLSVIISDVARAKVEDKVEERVNDKSSNGGGNCQRKPEQQEVKTPEKKQEPVSVTPQTPTLKDTPTPDERPIMEDTPLSSSEPKLRKKVGFSRSIAFGNLNIYVPFLGVRQSSRAND